jgi:hypothetical protein
MRKLFYLAVFLILLSGCMDVIGSSTDYATEYTKYLGKRIAASSEAEECRVGNCTCMVCENVSYFWNLWSSLAGGNCSFYHPCTPEAYEEINKEGDDIAARNFMYGAGPSFFDFGESNEYCHGKQTMAVHWLTGREGRDYDLPDAGRAMCMLQKEVIPVYVLYSGGENIDAGRSYEIGEELGWKAARIITDQRLTKVGPVIVTTEINYEMDDVPEVVKQIYKLNEGCGNHPPNDIKCFVAVAPRIGDREALDAVMNELGDDRDYVQMLAFGIDSHYSNGSCTGRSMGTMAEGFAAYGLYTYGLPSVIPYVLFDQGTVDPVIGCPWDENAVREGYRYFFPSGSIMLRDVGVVGIAPYSFNSSQYGGDPLHCNDCDIAANFGRLESWYGGCQRMVKISEKQQGGGFAVVFPNESGGDCNYVTQTDYFGSLYRDSYGVDILDDPVTPLEELEEITWRCDECLADGEDLGELYTIFKQYDSGGAKEKTDWISKIEGHIAAGTCERYPAIEYYSSRFSVDPMLVRGIIEFESNWHPCSVSCAGPDGEGGAFETADGRTRNCVGGRYSAGYDYIYDPGNVYYEGIGYCSEQTALAEPASPGDYRFLAMGLMQIMNSPYTYWPVEEGGTGEYEDLFIDAKDRGRTENVPAARFCSEEFNPFNASHNICRGTAQLGGITDQGEFADAWLTAAEARCTSRTEGRVKDLFDRSDRKRDEVMRTFVGIYKLTGVWENTDYDRRTCGDQPIGECWADLFCQAKQLKEETFDCMEIAPGIYPEGCVGEGEPDKSICFDICWDSQAPQTCNFIAFVDCMVHRGETGRDPRSSGLEDRLSVDAGLKKLFAFNYYNTHCENSHCPPYKQILKTDPTMIDNINPDMIDETTGEISEDMWRYLGPKTGED